VPVVRFVRLRRRLYQAPEVVGIIESVSSVEDVSEHWIASVEEVKRESCDAKLVE